ncbi:MAG: MFS transporter [Prochloraceae cyanobacterium]
MSIVNLVKILKPSQLKNLLLLFVAGFFFWVSISSLLPTLPTYIQSVGANIQQVGQVMGCFAIGLLLSRTLMGKCADLHSRKLVLLIGSFVTAVAPLGYIFFNSIPELMAIRAFHGISIAAFTIGYSALVVDFSPIQNRGESIGYMNLAVPTGMAAGPALGGYLVNSIGYESLFLVSASSGWLALFLIFQIKETKPETVNLADDFATKMVDRTFIELINSPSLNVPTVILLLVGLLFGTIVAFLPLYVKELNIDFNLGLFYTVVAIASFSVRIFVGKASDRYGRGLFITLSLLCYVFSMILLSVANSPAIFLLVAVAEGIGRGLLVPIMLALISDRSYDKERGKVFALCLGGFDVGIALAGPVLGMAIAAIGYRQLFSWAAILAVFAVILFATKANKHLSSSLRFAIGKEKDLYSVN